MNVQTGAIAQFETAEDAVKAGYAKPLTPKETVTLLPMNRHERRKWAAQQRHAETRPAK